MEEEFLRARSPAARFVDRLVDIIGTAPVLLLHGAVFSGWILVNNGYFAAIKPFDPFPYILLTMTVSMEGVLLALFVLMKQNRMSRRADERDHLTLQVNLLAEKEITKMLQMQQRMCEHFGIREPLQDPEVQELAQETAVENLADELRQKLPEK